MNQQQTEQTNPEQLPAFLADPLVVFLAGVFAGVVAGPQLLTIGRDMVKERGSELAAIAIDRFVNSLKGNLT